MCNLDQKTLRIIRNIIREKEDDIGCATIEEVEHVQKEIDRALYAASITEFRDMIDNTMLLMENDTDKFYDLTWTITYNGQSVRIENCATIYNAILEGLNDIVNDEL